MTSAATESRDSLIWLPAYPCLLSTPHPMTDPAPPPGLTLCWTLSLTPHSTASPRPSYLSVPGWSLAPFPSVAYPHRMPLSPQPIALAPCLQPGPEWLAKMQNWLSGPCPPGAAHCLQGAILAL